MPPKKKGAAKARTPAKSKAAAEPPATVTSNTGKEYDTTAASARPRRGATGGTAAPTPSKTATSKAKVSAPESAEAPKKRGRPAKVLEQPAEPTKKRGRPVKATEEPNDDTEPPKKRGRPAAVSVPIKVTETPKKRGRPAKAKPAVIADEEEPPADPPKKRGRPAKAKQETVENEQEDAAEPPKKRGRPAKAPKDAPAVPEAETAPPKKRGRPPKGGETTKMNGDDAAAAEQLEDELMDDIAPTSKQKSTTKKSTKATKPLKMTPAAEDTQDAEQGDEDVEGQQFWLMKAEQEDREETAPDGTMVNTKFTIDDLRKKDKPELWDGVRNHQAAKNMRMMRKGDLAFFYASGGKSGRKPSVVGVMEIVSEAEPDVTAADESGLYYEAKEAARKHWVVVGVEFRQKLATPVTLQELQKYKGERGALGTMDIFTKARLSVSKVKPAEWRFITEQLIEDYAGDAALTKTMSTDNEADSEQADHKDDDASPDVDQQAELLPLPDVVLPTVESDSPAAALSKVPSAKDHIEGVNGKITSGPTSRAASAVPSMAGIAAEPSARGGSRAPSVALATDVAAGNIGTRGGSRAPSAAPSVNGAAGKASVRGASRAPSATPSVDAMVGRTRSRAGSRARSAAPSLNLDSDLIDSESKMRPGSAGSLVPPSSVRPGPRGRPRTPKPRIDGAETMTSVAEGEKPMESIAE